MLYNMLQVSQEKQDPSMRLNLLQNERQVLEYEINYYPTCILL